MKKRSLKNFSLKKATISKVNKGGLDPRHGNHNDATVVDAEGYETVGWMSLPYSHCC